MDTPRLSILIPNFNNGRQSAFNEDLNFIEDLIRSLVTTLADDPTSLEIIIADDGSTDDSLATLHKWASRKWPKGWREGTPIFRLIELEHCGILSIVANRLVEESRGEILVRLDGDIVVHTQNWAEELCRAFAQGPPDLGVIGPKQLLTNGRVHAAGDWILHPRGYHHVASGGMPGDVTRCVEVDHVMGCFYCWKRDVWDDVGEFDENFLRGQTIDYGIRARLLGWRCISIPTIEFTHLLNQRKPRDTTADTKSGIQDSRKIFFDKWGFDRLAPDLAVVAKRYAGTPLLWNASVFGPTPNHTPSHPRLNESVWTRYNDEKDTRLFIDTRVSFVKQIHHKYDTGRRVVELGCGAGMMTHRLAKEGFICVGIDCDHSSLKEAELRTRNEVYPKASPEFIRHDDTCRLPLDDDTADILTIFDYIERHPNPIGLLREAHRVLKPEGTLAVLTTERARAADPDVDGFHFYRALELTQQVHHSMLFDVISVTSPGQETLHLIAKAKSLSQALPKLQADGRDQTHRAAA